MGSLLRFPDDRRSLAFCALGLTLLLVQWTGAARHPVLWVLSSALVFVGCVVKHNQMHAPTFRARSLNLIFQHALGLWTGTSCYGIVGPHNERHHKGNQGPGDFVRVSVVSLPHPALEALCYPFAAMFTMWRDKPADLPKWWRNQRPLFWVALAERLTIVALSAVALVVDAEATVLYLFLPWAFGQWALVGINWVQHKGCAVTEGPGCSHDVTGRFINWLLLNNGFHTAHHLQPGRHWSQLPALHDAEVHGRHPELEHRSLAGAVAHQLFG